MFETIHEFTPEDGKRGGRSQRRAEVHVYESLDEIVTRTCTLAREGKLQSNRLNDAEWVGHPCADKGWDAVEKALNGTWVEGMRAAEDMLDDLKDADLPRPVSRRRRIRWSEDDGDEVCLDRLRTGQPYWRESWRQTAAGPTTLTVIADVGCLAVVEWRDAMWRGIAAAVFCDLLEDAGYRVELWGVTHGTETYEYADCIQGVCLKHAGDSMDLSTLINGLSPWFFRTVLFGDMRSSRKNKTTFGLGGRGDVALPGVTRWFSPDGNHVVIDKVWNRDDALNLIRQSFANLGIQTEAA